MHILPRVSHASRALNTAGAAVSLTPLSSVKYIPSNFIQDIAIRNKVISVPFHEVARSLRYPAEPGGKQKSPCQNYDGVSYLQIYRITGIIKTTVVRTVDTILNGGV